MILGGLILFIILNNYPSLHTLCEGKIVLHPANNGPLGLWVRCAGWFASGPGVDLAPHDVYNNRMVACHFVAKALTFQGCLAWPQVVAEETCC